MVPPAAGGIEVSPIVVSTAGKSDRIDGYDDSDGRQQDQPRPDRHAPIGTRIPHFSDQSPFIGTWQFPGEGQVKTDPQ